MPRKRTVSDQDLLDAALTIVRTSGPEALTFSALAQRAGLAASTIVQRFGTKVDLLRAALRRAWDLLDEETAFATARAVREPSGVIDMLVALSGQYSPDDDFADQLLILREDLRDPVLRERGRVWLATLTEAIESRLGDAPGGAAGLGKLIATQWQGALTVWSFQRDAQLPAAVRASLEALFTRLGIEHESRLPR